jgi:hypothetical protein
MNDENKKIHNLAVKMAIQGYLDLWLKAEHLQPIKKDTKVLVDSTIQKMHDLEI